MLRCWKMRLANIIGYIPLQNIFVLFYLTLLVLAMKTCEDFHALCPLCPLLIGILIPGVPNSFLDLAQSLPPNSRMRELAIKSPRLWEEVERLVVNERIKIARDLHEKISDSTHTVALINMEACRERLLKNDSATAVQMIQQLRAVISDSIAKMRRYINQLRLDTFSAREASAIAGLASEVRDAARIPRFQQEVKKLILNERARIARDLHDEVIQNLATILIGLQLCERLLIQDSGRAAKELNSLEKLALDSDRKIRELSFRQLPKENNDFSLVPALQSYIKTFERVSDIDVGLRVQGKEKLVPRDVRINLMQIIKEAMANIIKHAEARRVDIRLSFRSERALALITDDGCGFDPEQALARAEEYGHLGLLSMRERARVFGGSLSVESEPGQGTRIFVDVPFN